MPDTKCTEALRLLRQEQLKCPQCGGKGSLTTYPPQGETRFRCGECREAADFLIIAALAQNTPACDAEKAVLVAALEIAGVAHQMYKHQTLVTTADVINQDKCGICKRLAAALAGTSPAAAALLAQGERHRKALELILRAPGQAKSIAHAALAPGEEKE